MMGKARGPRIWARLNQRELKMLDKIRRELGYSSTGETLRFLIKHYWSSYERRERRIVAALRRVLPRLKSKQPPLEEIAFRVRATPEEIRNLCFKYRIAIPWLGIPLPEEKYPLRE